MKKANKQNRINKKIILIISLLVISLLPLMSTFSRYAIKRINEFFNRSKEFYFYSDKLGIDDPLFLIDNWSGVEDYPIQINMSSMENNILGSSYDIPYEITYTCTNNAICTISKNSGVISKESNRDFFILTVTPNANLETGDEVNITINASTHNPYEKTISGRFTLRVGKENITYTIDDEINSPYLELKITNTQSYYIVDTPFDTYSQNQKITMNQYLNLSDKNKGKCHSARITLGFDPNVVTLDMTNSNYLNATNIGTTNINTFEYINSITFKVDAISSTTVRFYKRNVRENYTYPNNSNNSIINFTAN